MISVAEHFEEKGDLEKAVQLFQKAGEVNRALELCYKAGGGQADGKPRTAMLEALKAMADDMGATASPQVNASENAQRLYISPGLPVVE